MSDTTLYVTLDESTDPWTVVVNPPELVLAESTQMQTITWELSGNAASGSFPPLKDTLYPPFFWVDKPPAGIFNNPTVDGNQFSLGDMNPGSNSEGTWTYHLWIKVGDTYYQTVASARGTAPMKPFVQNL